MAENKKYLLELDEAHIKAILPALDLAARLHLGQLGMVAEYMAFNVNTPKKASPYDTAVRHALMEVKGSFFESDNLGAGYGIHNPEVSETARLLLDVHDVLRHRIVWDEAGNPPKRTTEMIQVWYDEVRQLAESVRLPNVINSGSALLALKDAVTEERSLLVALDDGATHLASTGERVEDALVKVQLTIKKLLDTLNN